MSAIEYQDFSLAVEPSEIEQPPSPAFIPLSSGAAVPLTAAVSEAKIEVTNQFTVGATMKVHKDTTKDPPKVVITEIADDGSENTIEMLAEEYIQVAKLIGESETPIPVEDVSTDINQPTIIESTVEEVKTVEVEVKIKAGVSNKVWRDPITKKVMIQDPVSLATTEMEESEYIEFVKVATPTVEIPLPPAVNLPKSLAKSRIAKPISLTKGETVVKAGIMIQSDMEFLVYIDTSGAVKM